MIFVDQPVGQSGTQKASPTCNEKIHRASQTSELESGEIRVKSKLDSQDSRSGSRITRPVPQHALVAASHVRSLTTVNSRQLFAGGDAFRSLVIIACSKTPRYAAHAVFEMEKTLSTSTAVFYL